MIQVVFFASVREQLGVDQLRWDAKASDVEGLLSELKAQGEPWLKALSQAGLLVAVNQEMSALDAQITDGDEVAFFPPVTGG